MDQERPMVSVLMTVFNREAYIAGAIESVLKSDFADFELIIVDDCSTDGSLNIARSFTDPRIQIYVNEMNLSDYPNRNRAASFANGKYLKYLDSDDIMYPHGLGHMVKRMEEFPAAALGLAKWSLTDRPFPVLLTPEESYQWSFLDNRYVFTNAPSSAIIKREAFESLGGFSGLNQVGDTEFWLKLAAKYPVLLMECGQAWSRDHPTSEKYKDSPAAKAGMIFNINLKALMSDDNPLTQSEKDIAIKNLRKRYKKEQARMFVRRRFTNYLRNAFRKL